MKEKCMYATDADDATNAIGQYARIEAVSILALRSFAFVACVALRALRWMETELKCASETTAIT